MVKAASTPSAAQLRRLRILAQVRAVPPGQVASYGEIARRAGMPRAARLVARLLASSEDPDLPWHRILRSDGRIAFPAGSAGFREQCARLREEGVRVETGRVRIERDAAHWLDAVLWGGSTAPDDADEDAGRG